MFTNGPTETRQNTPASPIGELRGLAQAVLDGARAWAGGALQNDACPLPARQRE